MKKVGLTLVAFFAFVAISNAQCTVSTDCETRTYTQENVTASNVNGIVTVSSNGSTIDVFSCPGSNSVSVSCSSTSGSGSGSGHGGFDWGSYGGFDWGSYGGAGWGWPWN